MGQNDRDDKIDEKEERTYQKIKQLGDSFCGVWQGNEFIGDKLFPNMWHVAFMYKGEYTETPAFNTADEALHFAIRKVHGLPYRKP